jgi:glycosyltransferase involved in cell wall biosynthesis
MRRILYFSRDYSTHDHRFLTALEKTGHQIYYLRLESRGHSLEDRPIPSTVEQVQWNGGDRTVRFRDGLRLAWDLKKVLKKINPDLVHAGPIQTAALLVALTGYRPLVSMSWGYDILVDAQKSKSWTWATRYALKRSSVMIGDCQTVRQTAVSYGMPEERIVTFPWGVDLGHFSPGVEEKKDPTQELRSRLGWGKDVFILLSTRSWESSYGVDILAEAFVLASRQHPELRLMMLGNGSLAARLRQIFARGEVDRFVIYPGQVKQAELPKYYRAADLYLSASHSDGTSISMLEALACGCPVLLSDIPGNLEWIKPGEQGWLFRDGDAHDLADKMISAVEDQKLLAGMRQKARRLAEERADWNKNSQGLLRAYRLAGLN